MSSDQVVVEVSAAKMIMKTRRVVRSVCYTVTLVFTMQVQSVWILWPECDKDSGHTQEKAERVSRREGVDSFVNSSCLHHPRVT